jgi:hypothetical protein
MRARIPFSRRVAGWRLICALFVAIGASAPAQADFLDDLFGGSDPAPAPAPRARPTRAPRDNFSIRLKETRRPTQKKIRDATDGVQYVAGSRPQKALLCATPAQPAGKIDVKSDDKTGEDTAYLRDETLRAGDSVVIPGQIVVFKGGDACPHASTDFVTVARSSLPKVKRNALAALQQGLKSPHRGFALEGDRPSGSNMVGQAAH